MKNFIKLLAIPAKGWLLTGILILVLTGPIIADTLTVPDTFVIVIDVSGSMNDAFPAPVQADLADSKHKILGVKRRLMRLAELLPSNTRVIVIVFDHQAKRVCDIEVVDAKTRQQLVDAFNSIEAGNGATFLWRTLDGQLDMARQLAKSNKESSVRVLVYTDGNDSEKNPQFTFETVLNKHAGSLRESLRLDWVTIGFDMNPAEKTAWENAGARVTKAIEPNDLIPLRAEFTLRPSDIKVGDVVELADSSLGLNLRQHHVDWGDSTGFQEGATLTHAYSKAGEFTVRYAVVNEVGKQSQASKVIRVEAHELPIAEIKVDTTRVTVGEFINASTVTSSHDGACEWKLDGRLIGRERNCQWKADLPGRHKLELHLVDARGQSASDGVEIEVALPTPPVAKFRFSSKSPRVGEQLLLINESSESAVRFLWSLPDGNTSTERQMSVTTTKYGTMEIGLQVWDQFDQPSTYSESILVPLPEAPKVDFTLPSEIEPNQPIVAIDRSTGEIVTDRWLVDGQAVGSGSVLKLEHVEPKMHTVRRVATGPGGEAFAEKTINVKPYLPPIAGFTIGSQAAYLGESLVITDISQNATESRFYIGDSEQPHTLSPAASADSRTWAVKMNRLGSVTIRQVCVGRGGTAEKTQNVTVSSRLKVAKACFEMVVDQSRAPAEATFKNLSEGDVFATVFYPGDGSAPTRLEGNASVKHVYLAGTYNPKIEVVSADELKVPVSQWTPERPLTVTPPLPVWLKQLWWILPTFVGLVAFAGFGWATSRKQARKNRLLMLRGTLSVQSNGGKPVVFAFSGKNAKESMQLDARTRATIESTIDRSSGDLERRIEIVRNEETLTVEFLEDDKSHRVAEYTVCYTS
ncbi:MAG: VWA domain-containing protein [Pirellulaceae bacterium]|nr:VWA domain-containing protein [Pirellulaceae bacterium]